MSFLLRSVEEKDLDDLISLTSQFYVMNLPPKKEILKDFKDAAKTAKKKK